MAFILTDHKARNFSERKRFFMQNDDGQYTSEQTALCLLRGSPKHGLTAAFQVNVIQNNAVIRS